MTTLAPFGPEVRPDPLALRREHEALGGFSLTQRDYWVTRDGRTLLLVEMEAEHKARAHAMLLRNHRRVLVNYQNLQYRSLGRSYNGSVHSSDAIERDIERVQRAYFANPEQWVAAFPLVDELARQYFSETRRSLR